MRADVAIVGGGPAGAAAAVTLRRYSSLSVIVLTGRRPLPCFGEGVGVGVEPLLEYLGVRDRFEAQGHLRTRATAFAWGDKTLRDEFLSTGQGDGWCLDRPQFDQMLIETAAGYGAQVCRGAWVVRVGRVAPQEWHLSLRGGMAPQSVEARFLIDASGRGGAIARQLQEAFQPIDRLVGTTGLVRFDGGWNREPRIYVESAAVGWWYSVPLPNDQLAVTLMTDADLLQRHSAHHANGWTGLLARTRLTRELVVGGHRPTRLLTRSAASHLLRPGGGDGWAATGDALAAYDPLSSLGIGHALASGASAARLAEQALAGKSDAHIPYASAAASHFAEFMARRRDHYAAEQRWAGEPFWSRRQSGEGDDTFQGDY